MNGYPVGSPGCIKNCKAKNHSGQSKKPSRDKLIAGLINRTPNEEGNENEKKTSRQQSLSDMCTKFYGNNA